MAHGNARGITIAGSGAFTGGVSNVGNTGGTTGMIASQLLFVGSNNITLSQSVNGNSATLSIFGGAGGGGGGVAISGGTQLATSGTVNWANSNGITFGMSGSTQMTASYTVPSTVGLLSAVNLSAGTTSNNLSAFTLSNSNNVSFGLNGSVITATVTTPAQTNQTGAIYVTAQSTGQSSSSTYDARSLSLVGDGIVSAGWSNGTLRISATQSNQAFSADALSTFQTLVLQDSNGISFSNNAGSIRLTHGLQFTSNTSNVTSNALHSSASRVFNVIAATNNTGGGTASLSSNVSFSNANGATFYTSAGNAVALSYTVPSTAGLVSAINISAGTTSNNLSAFTLSNSNNVSFGLNGSVVTATISVPAQTVQTLGLYAVSNTTGASSSSTVDARSLSFQGAGVASVGYSNGSVVISVPSGGGAGDGFNILAAGTQTATTAGSVKFVDSNGISWGMSGSTQITASYTVPSTAGLISAINASAGTTSNNLSAIVFSNSNDFSFGLNGSTITGSYTVPTVTNSSWSVSDAATSGTVGRLAFTNLNGVTLSLSTGTGGRHTIVGSHNALTSQSGQAFSAAGGSSAFQTLGFSDNAHGSWTNTNGSVALAPIKVSLYAASNTTQSSSGTQNLSSLIFAGAGVASVGVTNGSVIISVPAGGGAAGVANAAGTQTGTSGTIVFSNSNGYSFGMSNSSRITINGPTLNYYEPLGAVHSQAVVQGTVPLQNLAVPFNINATQLNMMLAHTGSSSGGFTLTFTAGLYTMSGSTASLASSASMSFGYNSTAATSYTNHSGTRIYSFSLGTWNLTPGNYLLGFICSSSSSQTAGTVSYLLNRSNYTLQGEATAGGNYTRYFGNGIYSASSSVLPNSVHLTQQVQSTNQALRQPWFAMAGAL